LAAPTQIGLSAFPATRPTLSAPFFTLLVAAGLLNTLIAAYFFLRLPADHHPSLLSLTIRAILYVLIGAAAGTLGSWFYWRRPTSPFRHNPPIPFNLFAIACASTWVFIPAVILFSRQDSPLTCAFSILAAALLAFSLRKIIPATPGPPTPALPPTLFADTLRTHPRRPQGYILSISIYFAFYELNQGWILDAAGLLAICAYTIFWLQTLEPQPAFSHHQPTYRATRRLAIVLIPAVLVTLYSLLAGIEHRNRAEAAALVAANGSADETKTDAPNPASANGISGYHSIILWPIPPKKEIVPPIPQAASFLAPGTTKPLVIQFTGPYYYFQPPHTAPSPTALQAKGTPLLHDIQTNNFMPLVMEAHQALGAAIPIARCREIQVGLLNGETRPGIVNIAVLLTDSAQPNNQLLLERQPLQSTGSPIPVSETLTFPIPAPAQITKFDHITVMFFPDEINYDRGSRVAIQQFQLIPR
jgi:hypothetical protein